MPNRGGGGGLAKDQTFSGFCFVHPSLKHNNMQIDTVGWFKQPPFVLIKWQPQP